MNKVCFLSLLHACKENHPDVVSVLGWQIILGTRAAFTSKKPQKTWDVFLFLQDVIKYHPLQFVSWQLLPP